MARRGVPTSSGLGDMGRDVAIGGGGVEDEVHLLLAVRGPEVDGDEEEGAVYLAARREKREKGIREAPNRLRRTQHPQGFRRPF